MLTAAVVHKVYPVPISPVLGRNTSLYISHSRSYPAWLWTLPGLGHPQPRWATLSQQPHSSSVSPLSQKGISAEHKFSLFQFIPITPCPILTIHDKEPLLSFPAGPLQILGVCSEVCPQPSLFQDEQSKSYLMKFHNKKMLKGVWLPKQKIQRLYLRKFSAGSVHPQTTNVSWRPTLLLKIS